MPSEYQFLEQGESATAVFFLKTGAVKVVVNDEMVAMIDTKQCFGEMSCLIPSQVASATVTTLQESTILKIDKEDFLEVVNDVPTLWKTLFLQMSGRVQSVNSRLSEVLHHSPQGLVKVNQEGVISKDYSIQCARYFNESNLTGLKIQDLLFSKDEERKTNWFDYYQLLFSNHMMTFDDISQLLDQEISLENDEGERRIYKLTYFPCYEGEDNIVAIDIGVEDITMQRELEMINQQMELQQLKLAKIYDNPDSYLNLLDLYFEIESNFFNLLENASPEKQVLKEAAYLMRRLHNAKGLSGLFALDEMKSACHNLETSLSANPFSLPDVERKHEIFKDEAQKARDLLQEINEELRRRLLGVCMDRPVYEELCGLLNYKQVAKSLKLLKQIDSIEASKLVDTWVEQGGKLADQLGKSVVIKVKADYLPIPREVYSELDKVLIHFLRNAIDHGVEDIDVRRERGKNERGEVEVNVFEKQGCLVFSVKDDGAGIDSEKIFEKALAKGGIDKKLVKDLYDNQEAWKILFLPGFSSKENLSDISGRGVGLDSVKTEVENLGGIVECNSEKGKFTEFLIKLPLN